MPDSKAKECYDCTSKFSTFRRKHHCRLCGQIFCSKCCNQLVPGRIIMCSGDLKVCNYCSKIVLSYLNSPDTQIDINTDLQALQEEITTKLSQEPMLPPPTTLPRKISVGYQEERLVGNQLSSSLTNTDRRTILQQSSSLKTLLDEMIKTLPLQNCGLDLIEYLRNHNKASNKVQALALLNAMLEANFLVPIVPDSEQMDFDENLHYKFAEKEDLSVYNAASEFCDHNSDGLQPPSISSPIIAYRQYDENPENHLLASKTTPELMESYCNHEENLVAQLLRCQNLDQSWAKDLMPLCARVVNQFKPEFSCNDLMDIRNYITIKKVPGGTRENCSIIGGVVCSKNVAHKDMNTNIEKPRILLLQCPIMYERIEGKYVSMSTVLLQEQEFLRSATGRIMSFKPNVVLVHKQVAGIAQDLLRASGVTLVLDVKLSVLERLSRCLQCDIITNVESNIQTPRLGTCDRFYIKSFEDSQGSSKTLMFFEKFSNARIFNCLLRGGSNAELAKVKKVASQLIYARYNWRLEMSFLLEEFAQPISPKRIIFESKENSPSGEEKFEEKKDISIEKKVLVERKSEEKLVTEKVSDNSDPLRAPHLNPKDESIRLSVETPYDNKFKTALISTILSVSPFVVFPLPYLETESGRKCKLRELFPNELFFSKLLNSTNERISMNEQHLICMEDSDLKLNPLHPFLTTEITTPMDNKELQTALAEFRAFGGRYPRNTNSKFFF